MKNILQGGVAKSGNYWLWKIIELTLKESSGIPSKFITSSDAHSTLNTKTMSHTDQLDIDVIDVDPTGLYWRVGPFIKREIKNFREYANSAEHIWTHSNYCRNFEEVFKYMDKTVYIIRHPADVARSQANFAFTPYIMNGRPHNEKNPSEYLSNRLEWSIFSWTENVSGWLAFRPANSHILFYENLKNDFENEYDKLLKYLDIELSDESYAAIKDSVDIKTMNINNPNHVRLKKDIIPLSSNQQKQINAIAGPLLEKLKYSDSRGLFLYSNVFSEKESHEFMELYKKSNISIFKMPKAIFSLIFSNRTLGDKLKAINTKIKNIIGKWINIFYENK